MVKSDGKQSEKNKRKSAQWCEERNTSDVLKIGGGREEDREGRLGEEN